MKRTIIAGTTAATLLGLFVCLPSVRGQNGQAASRAASSHAKTSPAAASGHSGALKIACIDMQLILKEYKKVADQKRELALLGETANAKIRQIQAEKQALVKRWEEDKVDQDSDEYSARVKKAYQIENSMKTCQSGAQREMQLQSVKIAAAVFEDVQAALKIFSEQRGFTLVLQIDRDAAKTEDYRMSRQVTAQPVVYYRGQEDITVAVLSYLNNHYQAERAEAGLEDTAEPAASAEQPSRTIPVSSNRKRATP